MIKTKVNIIAKIKNKYLKKLSPTQKTGHLAEEYAFNYLKSKGMELIERNYACKLGEIDLIMHDGNDIVFVEVRYKKSSTMIEVISSISPSKQQRIIKTAQYFLKCKSWVDRFPCRFDVIGITKNNAKTQVEWIQHAFCVQ